MSPLRDSRRYGRAHRHLRARWKPLVEAGGVDCWRCGKPIGARDEWDLGHDDVHPELTRGPEHQACNRGAAGRKAPMPNADPRPRVDEWWRA